MRLHNDRVSLFNRKNRSSHVSRALSYIFLKERDLTPVIIIGNVISLIKSMR